jgi:hypothetical protein
MVSAWFDDKKDGVHTGDYNDPRVACIQVVPDEIRYVSPCNDHRAPRGFAQEPELAMQICRSTEAASQSATDANLIQIQWYRTSTSVGQLVDIAKNAVGADVSAPGRLVTINASDVSQHYTSSLKSEPIVEAESPAVFFCAARARSLHGRQEGLNLLMNATLLDSHSVLHVPAFLVISSSTNNQYNTCNRSKYK